MGSKGAIKPPSLTSVCHRSDPKVTHYCYRCSEFKHGSRIRHFRRDDNGKDRAVCKDCESRYHQATRGKKVKTKWSDLSAEKRKELTEKTSQRKRERDSGWSPERFKQFQEDQNGKCAIAACDNAAICADHCHETEQPRAILCRQCNSALGLTGDSPRKLKELAEYVLAWWEEHHKSSYPIAA